MQPQANTREAHYHQNNERNHRVDHNQQRNLHGNYLIESPAIKIENTNDSFLSFEVSDTYVGDNKCTSDPLDELEAEIFDKSFQECFQILEEDSSEETTQSDEREDLIPHVLAVALDIGGSEGKHHLTALLDTGGSGAMINSRAVPNNAKVNEAPNGRFVTTAGTFESRKVVKLKKISFP